MSDDGLRRVSSPDQPPMRQQVRRAAMEALTHEEAQSVLETANDGSVAESAIKQFRQRFVGEAVELAIQSRVRAAKFGQSLSGDDIGSVAEHRINNLEFPVAQPPDPPRSPRPISDEVRQEVEESITTENIKEILKQIQAEDTTPQNVRALRNSLIKIAVQIASNASFVASVRGRQIADQDIGKISAERYIRPIGGGGGGGGSGEDDSNDETEDSDDGNEDTGQGGDDGNRENEDSDDETSTGGGDNDEGDSSGPGDNRDREPSGPRNQFPDDSTSRGIISTALSLIASGDAEEATNRLDNSGISYAVKRSSTSGSLELSSGELGGDLSTEDTEVGLTLPSPPYDKSESTIGIWAIEDPSPDEAGLDNKYTVGLEWNLEPSDPSVISDMPPNATPTTDYAAIIWRRNEIEPVSRAADNLTSVNGTVSLNEFDITTGVLANVDVPSPFVLRSRLPGLPPYGTTIPDDAEPYRDVMWTDLESSETSPEDIVASIYGEYVHSWAIGGEVTSGVNLSVSAGPAGISFGGVLPPGRGSWALKIDTEVNVPPGSDIRD